MNPVRVQFIREKILETRYDDGLPCSNGEVRERASLLGGMDVLDVGCGGGLLSEVSIVSLVHLDICKTLVLQSLARLGAKTLGVDASESNIAIASLHASHDSSLRFHENSQEGNPLSQYSGSLTYRHGSVEQLASESKRFDMVCSMEVLEHVDQPARFLRSCAELVKVCFTIRNIFAHIR